MAVLDLPGPELDEIAALPVKTYACDVTDDAAVERAYGLQPGLDLRQSGEVLLPRLGSRRDGPLHAVSLGPCRPGLRAQLTELLRDRGQRRVGCRSCITNVPSNSPRAVRMAAM